MAHDHLLEKAREFHRLIAAHPTEFALGYAEGDGDVGMTFDDDPGSDRSLAYDLGRSLRQGRGDDETITLTFVPQAWQNDYAVDADPEGPTTFTVPRAAVRGLRPDTHASDELRFHPNAPEWIKNWSGPFRIDFDESEADPPLDTADLQISLEERIGAYPFDHHAEGLDEGSAMDAGRHLLRQVVLGLSGDEHRTLARAYGATKDAIVHHPEPAQVGDDASRRTLDGELERWTVHEPGTWENDHGPSDWYAVSNDDGILAYFVEERDAFRFRLGEINRALNG